MYTSKKYFDIALKLNSIIARTLNSRFVYRLSGFLGKQLCHDEATLMVFNVAFLPTLQSSSLHRVHSILNQLFCKTGWGNWQIVNIQNLMPLSHLLIQRNVKLLKLFQFLVNLQINKEWQGWIGNLNKNNLIHKNSKKTYFKNLRNYSCSINQY